MFKKTLSPIRLSPTKSSPGVKSPKAKALTRAEVTSSPSLVHWRRIYLEQVPFLRQEKKISPEEYTDDELCRFLAEYNGDIRQWDSKGKIGKEWRQYHLPIPRSSVLRSLKTGKFALKGHDKVGRPVCYYRVKLHHPKDFTPEETLQNVVYEYENLLRDDAPITDEVCVVIDRTDAKMSNTDIEFLKLIYKTFKECYPGRGELFLVVGVNWTFRQLWNSIIVHFLDMKSRSSTYLLKDKTELHEFIDEDQIPEFLGGKLPYTFIPPEDEAASST